MSPRPTQVQQDHRIFAGAFPTGELAGRIQAIRLKYDRRTAEITPPHVTLAGTYWRSGPVTPESEAEAIASLESLSGKVAPFELRLGGVDFFPPAARPIVYLGVEMTGELLSARRALLQALGLDKHRSYHPHMTLAMRISGSEARAMLADLRDTPLNQHGLVAPIQELWLMQRGPHDLAWRRIGKVELGG